MVKLFGAQRMVLQAIQDSPKDPAGFVSDVQVYQRTSIALKDVRDWIETLEGEGYVEVARTEAGLSASITAKGRLQLPLFVPISNSSSIAVGTGQIESPQSETPSSVTSVVPGEDTKHPGRFIFDSWRYAKIPLFGVLATMFASAVLLSRDSSPLRLRPLKRWGDLSPVTTTILPVLGGVAIGLILPLKGLDRRAKAVAVLILFAVACISPVAYNTLTGTPPTPSNNWYYGILCFILLMLSNASIGMVCSVCLPILTLRDSSEAGRSSGEERRIE